MQRFPKLYLLLSSFLLLTGCSIAKYNHLKCESVGLYEKSILPVIKPTIVSKYNASIDVLKNHLTGLLIIKQMDSVTTRIVFVTELGMKMFDFEAKNRKMNVIYVFEPLNKPQLIEVLKRNFNNMLLLNLDNSTTTPNICNNNQFPKIVFNVKGKEKWYYSWTKKDNGLSLTLQETFHNRKRTSKINYTYNTVTQTYSQIKCRQYGFIKFYFELNEIQKSND
ncbi:MAG: hypothetical protein H7141_02830 [Burkholderiales bacterium]|nr:hypothetical protein [Bacteroidia bacterium]